MKKMLVLFVVILALSISSTMSFAQTESKGDTLIIGPYNSEGEPLGALNEALKADTTEAGERIHKVYKLQRKAQYILTEIIKIDFPLVLVADAPDAENRPPVIRCGVKSDGGNVAEWWHIFDDATFVNLWISGINLNGVGPIGWISQTVNATGKTITYTGCTLEFPYTYWAMFNDPGGLNDYIITDCVFKNIGNPSGTTWNGAIFHSGNADTVLIRNTTFFNFGCFAAKGAFYQVIDHCTFVNSVVHPVESHEQVIKIFTNNLFVNGHAFSDDDDEIKRHFDQEVKGLMNYAEIQFDPQALDSLYGPGGIYGKDWDPDGDGTCTHADLVWELKNNAWFYTDPVVNYWAEWPNVTPNPWMNNYNKAMFENKEGPWTWSVWSYVRDTADVIIDSTEVTVNHQPFKYFVEENTMNVDPGIVDMNNTDELLAQNCDNIRNEWAGETVEHVKWHNVENYLAFTWPFDFDLSYTNATLKTAGTDGKPVGSLQWWDEFEYTDVANTSAPTPERFDLKQNYPNPFNPTTNISYSLSKKSHVEIKVYNLLGAEVATLVDEYKEAGNFNIVFDSSDLASGVYFYQLKAGDKTMTRKMMLMK